MRNYALTLATLVAALFVIPTGAAATDPTAGPTCAGTAFTDPAGDAGGNDQEDIVAGWFDDSQGRVTANLQLKNLSTDVPAPYTAVNWYMVYTFKGATDYVGAAVDVTGSVSYDYGTLDSTTGYTSSGASTGTMKTGANGVISIALPTTAGGSDGNTITGPYGETDSALTVPMVGGELQQADDAPDSMSGGKDYTATRCDSTGATGTSGTTGDTGSTAPAAPPTTATTPAPAPAPPTAAALPLTIRGALGSAKKALKKRAISVRLHSTETLTNATLTLRSATHKTVASGKLKTINGNATAKLKVKGRTLKQGRYSLVVAATANGKPIFVTLAAKLSR